MPFIEIDGTSIHYHVEGTGVPIIFIHPPLLTSENFNYQKAQLSEKYKVVTFDIRGHGLSDYSAEPLTYPLIVNDIIQLMDHLEIKQSYICGYSTGGSIALEAIITHPSRFLGGILVSAMSEVSDWWLKTRISTAIALTSMKAKEAIAFSISWGNADSKLTFSKLFQFAKQGNVNSWKQYYRYSLVYNCTAQLDRIMAPMLLMYGQKDKRFYRYTEILHKRLPDNQLHSVQNAKHQIPTKNFLFMNNHIDHWISQHQIPTSNN